MNIETALKLTNAKNRTQLAKIIGVSKSAVYQWDENSIPQQSELKIYKFANLIKKPKTSKEEK